MNLSQGVVALELEVVQLLPERSWLNGSPLTASSLGVFICSTKAAFSACVAELVIFT